MKTRTEKDSMGEVRVPEDALYQAQTQRAVDNFNLRPERWLAFDLINALLDIKAHAASTNARLGKLEQVIAHAIVAGRALLGSMPREEQRKQFPVPVFQTGSGTSSNMNVNEVLATLASRESQQNIHPNDHVNCSQSSNDVFPSAIQIALYRSVNDALMPAISSLCDRVGELAKEHQQSVKVGRTHLMDAMPVTFGMELETWRAQMLAAQKGIESSTHALLELPLGGTAVGTGVNSSYEFAYGVCSLLEAQDGHAWHALQLPSTRMSGQEHHLALASSFQSLAVVLTKIANDLRWMNSGPVHGLMELQLPALQPGSSIMPAKVNPVIPEAVVMAAIEVMSDQQAVMLAAQSGSFQLNVCLPLIADKLFNSLHNLADACSLLEHKVFHDLRFNTDYCLAQAHRNPIMVTALNETLGYELAARIAKRAHQEQRSVLDVALEESDLDREALEKLLDPLNLV